MAKKKSQQKPKRAARADNSEKDAAKASPQDGPRRVEARIQAYGGWKAIMLANIRRLILEADPEVEEACKWIKRTNPLGVPVWSHAGIVCTGEAYKQVVKVTFARGAALEDPQEMFNASLEGNARRAIDLREGETLDAEAFQALYLAAVAENLRASDAKAKPVTKSVAKMSPSAKAPTKSKGPAGKKVVLLTGGNPQIAKAEGDAPVQAYIAAMPGWKRDLGQRLDALILRGAPRAIKAVKWNSPFYGIEGQGWFLSFHVFTQFVKVTFFAGQSLHPVPPGGTPKSKESRWIDIREGDALDEAQFVTWVKQAAKLPGWTP